MKAQVWLCPLREQMVQAVHPRRPPMSLVTGRNPKGEWRAEQDLVEGDRRTADACARSVEDRVGDRRGP